VTKLGCRISIAWRSGRFFSTRNQLLRLTRLSCRRANTAARQQLEKRLDLFRIEPKLRRKLPQNRPELRAQSQHTRCNKFGQRLAYFSQPQHVRDVPRTLYRKDKILRRGVGPARKINNRWSLQRVERAVDLDRPENPGRLLQFTRLRQIFGIESPAPALIPPAGNPNPHFAEFLRLLIHFFARTHL